MVITGTYGADGIAFDTMTADVTDNVSVTPEVLTDGITTVKFSLLNAEGKEVSVTCPVTVHAKLTELIAATPIDEYEYGDTFPSTYTVTAKYSDGNTQTVSATCGNTALTSVGTHNIQLSYTDSTLRDTTVTTTMAIDVKRKTIPYPSLKGVTIVYTGNNYDIASDTYLNNYNSAYYTVTGNVESAAGPHVAKFTPTANYRWLDGTNGEYSLNWTIASVVVTVPTVDQTEFTYSGIVQGPTFTYDGINITASGTAKQTAAGTYKATFTLKDPDNMTWASTFSGEIEWEIKKLEIAEPSGTPLAFTFNGSDQVPTFTRDMTYTDISLPAASSDVGNYSAIVSLKDKQNTTWADGTTADKTISWNINILALDIPTADNTNYIYNGIAQGPVFSYNSTYITAIGDVSSKINAGSYKATFTLNSTTNTKWSDNTTTAKEISWTIARAIIATKPTPQVKTYSGSEQIASWNNYSSAQLTIGGTTKGTNAGSYNATFTPTSNYQWATSISADVTATITIAWTINKKSITPTVSKTTISFSSSLKTDSFTVACGEDTGFTYTVSTSNTAIAAVAKNGNSVTVTADGSTAGNATVTVALTVSANYILTTATLTVAVTATYWTEPTNGSTPTTQWWNNLGDSIQDLSDAQLDAMVGKELTVTLNSAVLGTTTHKVVCIGRDIDRDKNNPTKHTLTFQTLNTLSQLTTFGSSNGLWNGSIVRSKCQEYYNALPFKSSVKTVSKGTCTTTNSSQTGTPTYQDETVFLPSDCEMGFPKGHNYNSGLGYAVSYDEFCQQNTAKKAYPYYNSNARRIKKQGDSGSAQYYWERSLYYYNAGGACLVYYDGQPGSHNYDVSSGLAPAFVI